MKLKDFLKQFEGCDPEMEMDSLDIWTDVLLQERQLKDDEYSKICSIAFDDGYISYKNLNPYRKGTERYSLYEDQNNRGMIAADR